VGARDGGAGVEGRGQAGGDAVGGLAQGGVAEAVGAEEVGGEGEVVLSLLLSTDRMVRLERDVVKVTRRVEKATAVVISGRG
jgi:hypothetical protein